MVIAFIIMGVLMLLGVYFLSFTLTESRIARSQVKGTQGYYLAEAGINKAIWKLKYGDEWSSCFTTSTGCGTRSACDATWTDSFTTSTNALISNSTTTVTVVSPECGRGRITATSTIALAQGKTAQRVVETTVFQALGSLTDDAAIFSCTEGSEKIDIEKSDVRVYGNLFSNGKLEIDGNSTVKVYQSSSTSTDGKVLVVKGIDGENRIATSIAKCAENICETTSTCECTDKEVFDEWCQPGKCPPNEIGLAKVDFASASSTSFRSRAQVAEDAGDCRVFKEQGGVTTTLSTDCVFNSGEFDSLLGEVEGGGTLTLGSFATPTITYVTGPIDLEGGHLVVNGALVAEGRIKIESQITVNRPTATTASGLLAEGKIYFGPFSSLATTTITGVIYSMEKIKFYKLSKCKVTGGVIASKKLIIKKIDALTVILDNEIIRYGLGYKIDGIVVQPQFSPIITIEHWEETY